jgi:hypothetical protein
MAEVAREIDHDDPRVSPVQGKGKIEAVVGRAVIDHQQFDIVRDGFRRGDNASIEFANRRR